MELFTTVDNVIIQDKKENESLWCNRVDGKLIPVAGKLEFHYIPISIYLLCIKTKQFLDVATC